MRRLNKRTLATMERAAKKRLAQGQSREHAIAGAFNAYRYLLPQWPGASSAYERALSRQFQPISIDEAGGMEAVALRFYALHQEYPLEPGRRIARRLIAELNLNVQPRQLWLMVRAFAQAQREAVAAQQAAAEQPRIVEPFAAVLPEPKTLDEQPGIVAVACKYAELMDRTWRPGGPIQIAEAVKQHFGLAEMPEEIRRRVDAFYEEVEHISREYDGSA